ncbi:mitochondrial nicotinamide adenine dinucleotide transporter SLC25A51-like [Hydractinia symbiolongicarpus]|uniref:mitochondrial nicotinamide adenine dinucleotide transporter SLC25A51-like n=1 Tax=Hydractinia symbiolongicarpus TaxID=13093 RepID=UPI00254FEB19|nr:mitochondrial nicotinamide adenine dinucleotide transporter SLC25A51-like [Hydractinia symbiolongicarpus]
MSKNGIKIEKEWHEYVAGAGAAAVNILITFPAYKLMIRQQVDGITVFTGFQQLKREGLCKLYRGVGPPLLQKGASLSIMFGSYHSLRKKILEKYPHANTTTVTVVSAMLAGTLESVLTPLERIQTLLAISEHKNYVRVQNTVHAFLKINKHHNFREYYRGYTAILLRNGPSTALFFLFREPIKAFLPEVHSSLQDFVEDFVSGAVLGATISTLAYPLNVVKSNMQKRLGVEHKSIVCTFKEIYNMRGQSLRKMYLGVNLNFSRSLLSWGIINASYEYFMKVLNSLEC